MNHSILLQVMTPYEYALKHNLLDEPGWKLFRHYTRNKNKLGRIVNQTKVSSYRREPFWRFGVLVSRTHKLAIELDIKNNNKRWQDAEATEMNQLLEYQTFLDKGKGGEAPIGYKKI
jgi:hypothetical protein